MVISKLQTNANSNTTENCFCLEVNRDLEDSHDIYLIEKMDV